MLGDTWTAISKNKKHETVTYMTIALDVEIFIYTFYRLKFTRESKPDNLSLYELKFEWLFVVCAKNLQTKKQGLLLALQWLYSLSYQQRTQ